MNVVHYMKHLHFLRNPVRDIRLLTRKVEMTPGVIKRRQDDMKISYTSNGYPVADAIFSLKSGECSIYVEDHLQGMGIGKQVLEEVRRELITRDVPSIFWYEYGLNPIRPFIPGFKEISIKQNHVATAIIDPDVLVRFKWSKYHNKMVAVLEK